MAIFRIQYMNSDGQKQVRLVEADWQADVEREIQLRGHQLLHIEHVSTVADRPAISRAQKGQSGFWSFRRFVTPSWICFVFGTNVALVVLGAGYSIYRDVSAIISPQHGRYQLSDEWLVLSIVATVVIGFLYLFSLRIILECVIVLFRIYDELVASRRSILEKSR